MKRFFLCISLINALCVANVLYGDTVDTYVAMLRSSDDDTREQAAQMLGSYHDARAVDALIFALNDPEDEVVEKAAKSLGAIGDPRAVDPLTNLLTNFQSNIKGSAAEALGNIGDPRALPALEHLLATDWNPFLKGVVRDAIVKCRANVGSYHYSQPDQIGETVVVSEPVTHSQTTPHPILGVQPEPEPMVDIPQGPVAKIAVLSFRDTASAGTNIGFGDAVSEMLTTALIRSERFEVIERAQIAKILEEQQFSVSGSVDSDTAIELGRLLGVEYIIVGSIARLGSLFETDVRFIETKSGKGIIAESGTSRGEENLRPMVNSIADKLVSKYSSVVNN